jgi:transcriptional regulator with XRE-family HTH domain
MRKKDIKANYAVRLRELRKKYAYTQQKLAELSDIEYKHVQRLESKKPCDIKLSTLKKLAKAFGMPVSALVKNIE